MHTLLQTAFVCIASLLFFLAPAQQPNQRPVPREADSLFFHFKYKDALEKYQAFIKANSNALPPTFARMAFSSHFLGKYKEAIALYDSVLSKNPGPGLRAQLYSRMAMTYSMKKDKQKALMYLDSARANGYFNTYEMDHFDDYSFIRNEKKFKEIYDVLYTTAFPCRSLAGARQFDFWIGDWDVFNNLFPNNRVGTSHIQNVSGECTILENWESYNNPFTGKSQNWYDTTTKKWTQLWIGSGGGVTYFREGEYKDGAMRFVYSPVNAQGQTIMGRFTFYNLGKNKVRQFCENSNDNGKTYQTVYDFIYVRQGTNGE
jgi:hypothetical protein